MMPSVQKNAGFALALGFFLNEVGVMSFCRAKNYTKDLH